MTAIWVRAAKFIYGHHTRGLLHDELFTRVNFPLKSNIYEAFSAAWMQKIISTGQPEQIIDLIRLPRSRDKCKLTPNQLTRSGRFKRSAIISGITNYNKIHAEIRCLPPDKCSKIIKTQGLFTKPEDLTSQTFKLSEKLKPKISTNKNSLETFAHLIRHLMDEAPIQDINDTIMDMEEHYDLNEFNPF